jgi:hypothetical protein
LAITDRLWEAKLKIEYMAGSERDTHAAEMAVFRIIHETPKLMETTKKGYTRTHASKQ